jgi:hypothetical protein
MLSFACAAFYTFLRTEAPSDTRRQAAAPVQIMAAGGCHRLSLTVRRAVSKFRHPAPEPRWRNW